MNQIPSIRPLSSVRPCLECVVQVAGSQEREATITTFLLTSQSPYGFEAHVRVCDRDIAERLKASWMQSGFTNVKMKPLPGFSQTPRTTKKCIVDDARRERILSVALLRGLLCR
jgi:hypothetical protein